MALELFSFDGETNLGKIKNKKLKGMIEEAKEIQEELKEVLIKNFREIESEKDEPILKKGLKKILKGFKKEIKSFSGEEDREEKLLRLISKKDWKILHENIVDDNEKFYSRISNLDFDFLMILKEELSGRSCEKIIEEVKEKVKGV